MGTSRHWWNAQFPVVWASYGSYGHSSLILGPILHHRSSQSPASHGAQTLWPCPHWTPGSLEAHLSTNVSTVINMLVILIIYQTNKCSISEYGFFWKDDGVRVSGLSPFEACPNMFHVSHMCFQLGIGSKKWTTKMPTDLAPCWSSTLKHYLRVPSYLPSSQLKPKNWLFILVLWRIMTVQERAGTCIILLCGYPLVN